MPLALGYPTRHLCAFLHAQCVCGEVGDGEREGGIEVAAKVGEALVGKAVDEVDGDVAEPLIGIVATPKEAQRGIVEALEPKADAIDTKPQEVLREQGADIVGVQFGSNLGIGGNAEVLAQRGENPVPMLWAQH